MDSEHGMDLARIEFLLQRELLGLAPSVRDPLQQALLYFEDVPAELLARRKDALATGEGAPEWILLRGDDAGAEWLEEMRGTYGMNVITVESLGEVRERLEGLVSHRLYLAEPAQIQLRAASFYPGDESIVGPREKTA